MGQGSMTGRELGFCAGYDTPGYVKGGGMGRGFGFGGRRFRGGRGWGGGWGRAQSYGASFPGYAGNLYRDRALSREEEIRMLKADADALKREQKEIEKRLSDLEKETETKS